MIRTVAEPAFAADLNLNLFFFLTFFGHDINQTTAAAAAVQGGRTGNHFNMIDIERINRIQLAAVTA